MRGRKPKPVEQRIREGNARDHALPAPVLAGGRPSSSEFRAPARLDRDGRAWWDATVPYLIESGIADRVDLPVLEQIAQQFSRIRQAQRRLKRDGIFAKGSMGQLREHPGLKVERDATAMVLRLSEQYGLTPVARTRLGLAELHARSLEQELVQELGPPRLRAVGVVQGTAVEDESEVDD